MSFNDIYNLIIASVPALTAIITCGTLFYKIIKTLAVLVTSVRDNGDSTKLTIEELKAQNAALQNEAVETKKEINHLTKLVAKVVDKVDDTYGSEQTNQAE